MNSTCAGALRSLGVSRRHHRCWASSCRSWLEDTCQHAWHWSTDDKCCRDQPSSGMVTKRPKDLLRMSCPVATRKPPISARAAWAD